MLIKDLFEAKGKFLQININKHTTAGEKMLISNLSISTVDEVDADELEDNSEGNLDGTVLIWMGADMVEVTGENFSPLFKKFDTLSDKKKLSVLDGLKEKIKQEMPSIS